MAHEQTLAERLIKLAENHFVGKERLTEKDRALIREILIDYTPNELSDVRILTKNELNVYVNDLKESKRKIPVELVNEVDTFLRDTTKQTIRPPSTGERIVENPGVTLYAHDNSQRFDSPNARRKEGINDYGLLGFALDHNPIPRSEVRAIVYNEEEALANQSTLETPKSELTLDDLVPPNSHVSPEERTKEIEKDAILNVEDTGEFVDIDVDLDIDIPIAEELDAQRRAEGSKIHRGLDTILIEEPWENAVEDGWAEVSIEKPRTEMIPADHTPYPTSPEGIELKQVMQTSLQKVIENLPVIGDYEGINTQTATKKHEYSADVYRELVALDTDEEQPLGIEITSEHVIEGDNPKIEPEVIIQGVANEHIPEIDPLVGIISENVPGSESALEVPVEQVLEAPLTKYTTGDEDVQPITTDEERMYAITADVSEDEEKLNIPKISAALQQPNTNEGIEMKRVLSQYQQSVDKLTNTVKIALSVNKKERKVNREQIKKLEKAHDDLITKANRISQEQSEVRGYMSGNYTSFQKTIDNLREDMYKAHRDLRDSIHKVITDSEGQRQESSDLGISVHGLMKMLEPKIDAVATAASKMGRSQEDYHKLKEGMEEISKRLDTLQIYIQSSRKVNEPGKVPEFTLMAEKSLEDKVAEDNVDEAFAEIAPDAILSETQSRVPPPLEMEKENVVSVQDLPVQGYVEKAEPTNIGSQSSGEVKDKYTTEAPNPSLRGTVNEPLREDEATETVPSLQPAFAALIREALKSESLKSTEVVRGKDPSKKESMEVTNEDVALPKGYDMRHPLDKILPKYNHGQPDEKVLMNLEAQLGIQVPKNGASNIYDSSPVRVEEKVEEEPEFYVPKTKPKSYVKSKLAALAFAGALIGVGGSAIYNQLSKPVKSQAKTVICETRYANGKAYKHFWSSYPQATGDIESFNFWVGENEASSITLVGRKKPKTREENEQLQKDLGKLKSLYCKK